MKTILTAFLFLLSSKFTFAQPFLTQTDVFSSGQNGVALYRIPGVVTTSKGTVLAYCEARKSTKADWGEIEVHLSRSIDGGKTWEPTKHIAHKGERIEGNPTKKSGGEREQTVNNPVAIVDRETGAIEFLYCVNYARCFSMRSVDEGVTWSKPIEVTPVFEPLREKYDWKVIATGPGHGIQIKSGRLLIPIWLAYGKLGDHHPSAAGTIFSDDHGKTWQAGDISVPDEGQYGDPNESILAELLDGRVMMISRSESKPSRKLITYSFDGATNWTKPIFQDELWEPICMASLISQPSSPGTLIFSNPHSLGRDKAGNEIPGGRGKRENLSIKMSRDSGKTWPVNKTLERGNSAYSDLTSLADDTILCLYESQNKIVAARFNREWIESP